MNVIWPDHRTSVWSKLYPLKSAEVYSVRTEYIFLRKVCTERVMEEQKDDYSHGRRRPIFFFPTRLAYVSHLYGTDISYSLGSRPPPVRSAWIQRLRMK